MAINRGRRDFGGARDRRRGIAPYPGRPSQPVYSDSERSAPLPPQQRPAQKYSSSPTSPSFLTPGMGPVEAQQPQGPIRQQNPIQRPPSLGSGFDPYPGRPVQPPANDIGPPPPGMYPPAQMEQMPTVYQNQQPPQINPIRQQNPIQRPPSLGRGFDPYPGPVQPQPQTDANVGTLQKSQQPQQSNQVVDPRAILHNNMGEKTGTAPPFYQPQQPQTFADMANAAAAQNPSNGPNGGYYPQLDQPQPPQQFGGGYGQQQPPQSNQQPQMNQTNYRQDFGQPSPFGGQMQQYQSQQPPQFGGGGKGGGYGQQAQQQQPQFGGGGKGGGYDQQRPQQPQQFGGGYGQQQPQQFGGGGYGQQQQQQQPQQFGGGKGGGYGQQQQQPQQFGGKGGGYRPPQQPPQRPTPYSGGQR